MPRKYWYCLVMVDKVGAKPIVYLSTYWDGKRFKLEMTKKQALEAEEVDKNLATFLGLKNRRYAYKMIPKDDDNFEYELVNNKGE